MIDEGLSEFNAHNFEEARSLFLRAHALSANARTQRALGLAEFELRNYVESVGWLEDALASTERPLDAALRAETQAVLDRAYGFVARVRVNLQPASARLGVDGEVGPNGPLLLLRIGEHKLTAEAPGMVAQQRRLQVNGGETLNLSFVLTAIGPAAQAQAESTGAVNSSDTRSGEARRSLWRSPWLWAGVGVVLAGAIAGGAYALTRDRPDPEYYAGTSGATIPGP